MVETLAPAITCVIETLAHDVLRRACDRHLTLVTAESCTGGMLASLLTDVDGCGHAFERGFVVYTDASKRELLDVPAAVLSEAGAVSEACVKAMADGALARSNADVVIAVTGFAGRGGPDEEPGLVHFAAGRRGQHLILRTEHFGDVGRGAVRLACLETALTMARDVLEQEHG